MNVRIHPGAAEDIERQARFYDSKRPGLGVAFLNEVDDAIELVCSMPEAFPQSRKNIRIFVFRRFPFSMFYRVKDQSLEILVVRHHARHEDYGVERF